MKASILDLRRRMRDVLRSLDRGEPVTIVHRGRRKGVLYPAGRPAHAAKTVSDHPAFGMWRDRDDLRDVEAAMRRIRKGRLNAV